MVMDRDTLRIKAPTATIGSSLGSDFRFVIIPDAILRRPAPGSGNSILRIKFLVDVPSYRTFAYVHTTIQDLVDLRHGLTRICRSKRAAPVRFTARDPCFSFGLYPEHRPNKILLIGSTDREDYATAVLDRNVTMVHAQFKAGVFGNLLFAFPVTITNLRTAGRQLSTMMARIKRM
jgi:hypothetical protein